MALLNRLNTDRSLGVFAGKFVPLKVTTDGNPEWSAWARKYPVDGNGIPILYVIRADGEMLYGKTGSLQGDALPQMLQATLAKSGRILSDAETKLLADANTAAETAMNAQDAYQAAAALSQTTKVGLPGKLNSFSTHARKTDVLATQIGESLTTTITEAKSQLTDESSAFDGILALTEAEAALAAFPEIRKSATDALRDARKDAALRELLEQAEALTKAQLMASSANPAVQRRAPKALESVIERYPGSKAAELARAELGDAAPSAADDLLDLLSVIPETPARQGEPAGANPDGDSATNNGSGGSARIWTAANGRSRVEATLVRLVDGKVHLRKTDGKVVIVPVSKLSEADQAFLQER